MPHVLSAILRIRPSGKLQHDIKAYNGSSAAIELKAAGGVERSAEKALKLINLRK